MVEGNNRWGCLLLRGALFFCQKRTVVEGGFNKIPLFAGLRYNTDPSCMIGKLHPCGQFQPLPLGYKVLSGNCFLDLRVFASDFRKRF